MSNRFCVILNQGNNILTVLKYPHDKLHKLRQGHLLIGEHTPYKSYNQEDGSWHIIGHIDNLPLLNYLLFSYYPSAGDLISEEIISFAVKRYGMKIIELLKGNFCIIYEDAEGNLTLVTEDDQSKQPAEMAKHIVVEDSIDEGASPSEQGYGNGQRAPSPAGRLKEYPGLGGKLNVAAPSCQCPRGIFKNQRRISVTRWHDNNLQFIQSFRCPLYSALKEVGTDEKPEPSPGAGRCSF